MAAVVAVVTVILASYFVGLLTQSPFLPNRRGWLVLSIVSSWLLLLVVIVLLLSLTERSSHLKISIIKV